jgi:hypothetical protein
LCFLEYAATLLMDGQGKLGVADHLADDISGHVLDLTIRVDPNRDVMPIRQEQVRQYLHPPRVSLRIRKDCREPAHLPRGRR